MVITYELTVNSDSVDFKILKQSGKVKSFFDFLERLGKTEYMAKNGYRIRISKRPEWRQSENTIYLQGSDTLNNNRTDTTRFANKSYAKRSVAMFDEAMREFADSVKKADNAGLLKKYYNSYVKLVTPDPIDYFMCFPVTKPVAKTVVYKI